MLDRAWENLQEYVAETASQCNLSPHDALLAWQMGLAAHKEYSRWLAASGTPKSGESPSDSPAWPVQHAQPAILLAHVREVLEELDDFDYKLDVDYVMERMQAKQQASAQ